MKAGSILNRDRRVHEKAARRCRLLFRRWSQTSKAEDLHKTIYEEYNDMSRVFISGSSDGLGLMAAQLLVEQGHSVLLHARNSQRAEVTHRRFPRAEAVVTGDLSSL